MAAELGQISLGRSGFIERHGLWTQEQREEEERIRATIEEQGIQTVRLSFGDQHGILRGKTLIVREFLAALRNGYALPNSLFFMDTTNHIVFPIFTAGGGFGLPEMEGGGDVILVPDPHTFRVLPWASKTGWVLGDVYFPSGTPVPFATRHIYRNVLNELRQKGFEYIAGLEVEFYITKLEDPRLRPEQSGYPPEPPQVSFLTHGYQYLTEFRIDEIDPILEILRENLVGVGLPLRSMEDEWGPSQCEFTFDPGVGLEPADDMLLFRSAVKQICRRHGYHATFMCLPALPNVCSSGWHLHQSLRSLENGENAFTPRDNSQLLSDAGRYFVGGILRYANAFCVFTNPTINGYKRFKPDTLAPDRVAWARDNKGAMIRVVGGVADPVTHIENRVGEPAANPYLYMASQVIAGMKGMEKKIDPGEPTEEPYAVDKPPLPRSLMEAVAALKEDSLLREKMGDAFINYIIALKEFEIGRFLSYVTDWEHQEYFEVF